MSGKFGRWSLWVFGLLAAAVGSAMAAGAAGAQGALAAAAMLKAVRVDEPPAIDGNLDDSCWRHASVVREFWRTDKELPATEPTEAYLAYDDGAIYVAFRCRDTQPDEIRAAERRRNGDIWSDDRVGFSLDTQGDACQFYAFNVTPRGTQHEEFPGGRAPKIEWRGDWTAAVKRTPQGWQAEMAIPFSILRYRQSTTTFRVIFQRYLARERESSVHPNMAGKWDNTLAPYWSSLVLPKPEVRPLFMPYVAARAGEDQANQVWTGLDVKHTFPSGLTAAAAFNPDFESVEEIVESISYSYTERYLPEVRPFLVEGNAYFTRPRTPGFFGGYGMGRLWYSRRVGDIDAGVKAFGKVGRHTIGLLDAEEFGESHSLVACYQQDITPRSHVRVALTNRHADGEPDNTACGLEAFKDWERNDGGLTLWMQLQRSRTSGPGGDGANFNVGGGRYRGSGQVGWEWNYRRTSADYNPALGFYGNQGTSLRGGSGTVYYSDRIEHGPLQDWGTSVHAYRFETPNGDVFKQTVTPEVWADWRSGWSLWLCAHLSAEYAGFDSSDVCAWVGWNQKDLKRRGTLYLVDGTRADSDYRYASLWQTLPLSRDWSVGVRAEYVDHKPPAGAGSNYQVTLTTSYDLTDERSVGLRVLKRRQGGANVFASYRQVVRRGMDMYVLLGDPKTEESGLKNRVALKLVMAM